MRVLLPALLLLGAVASAHAQADYPSRPVRIVVPSEPGGGTDISARILAEKLSQSMNQQFVVENRPGAGQMIGTEQVARSPNDGYTLLVAAAAITILPATNPNVKFDILRDFAPVSQLVSSPSMLVTPAKLPFGTLKDFIAGVKAKPGEFNFGSAGVGTQPHMAMELFRAMAGLDMQHIPYKGIAPALNGVIASQVSAIMINPLTAKSQIDAGNVRGLGISSPARSADHAGHSRDRRAGARLRGDPVVRAFCAGRHAGADCCQAAQGDCRRAENAGDAEAHGGRRGGSGRQLAVRVQRASQIRTGKMGEGRADGQSREIGRVSMLKAVFAGAALVCLIASAAQAQSSSAQSWPNKPVKILVPTAAGGMADTLARMYAAHLSKVLGQQFYIENRGGAGNTLGIESVARSPADGYTLLLGAGTITMNHVVYKKLPYDVIKDFTPVTQMVSVPNVLVVHPSQPFNSLADYIAAAKAKPGTINFASAGVGSNLHLSMELLKTMTGIDVVHVPYKGVGPAMSDTLAGHVMSMVSNVASAKAHVESGKLRALAVTSRNRAPALPNTPSVSEAGVKGYEVLNWFGLFAPAGTPQPIIDRLQAEAVAMFATPEAKTRIAGEGAEPVASKPADFAVFVKAEIAKWTEVGKAANIQPTE